MLFVVMFISESCYFEVFRLQYSIVNTVWQQFSPQLFFLAELGEPHIAWDLWIDMFEAYVEVLEEDECSQERKLALLKHRLGAVGLREFKNLPTLENPGDLGVYQIALKQMQERFGREINVVMECFKFYSRAQKADESIDQYVPALRGLAVTCEFDRMTYDQVLRDQILMKTKLKKIQEKLWSSGSVSLKTCYKTREIP